MAIPCCPSWLSPRSQVSTSHLPPLPGLTTAPVPPLQSPHTPLFSPSPFLPSSLLLPHPPAPLLFYQTPSLPPALPPLLSPSTPPPLFSSHPPLNSPHPCSLPSLPPHPTLFLPSPPPSALLLLTLFLTTSHPHAPVRVAELPPLLSFLPPRLGSPWRTPTSCPWPGPPSRSPRPTGAP